MLHSNVFIAPFSWALENFGSVFLLSWVFLSRHQPEGGRQYRYCGEFSGGDSWEADLFVGRGEAVCQGAGGMKDMCQRTRLAAAGG